jgi:hypothetical protein
LELFFGAFTSEWEQRRAALLHELSLGGGRSTAEEELRRRMKALAELGAAGGGGAAPMTRHAASKSMHSTTAKASMAARPMQIRLAAVAQENTAVVIACILQRATQISSAGGYLRVLTDKARAGEFSVGPMLMAALRAQGRPNEAKTG